MKNIFLFFFLFSFPLLSQSQEDEVRLIEPIKETAPMSLTQARSFSKKQSFRNWGVEALQLNSIMTKYSGKGVKVCICDTGEPEHNTLKGSIKESINFSTDSNAKDQNGHSTHVAGIVNEIAPDAELYFAKVLNKNGSGSNTRVKNGIDWCVYKKADIINLSLGSPSPSPVIKEAIDAAIKNKILIVAAVGNDGTRNDQTDIIGYPAKYEETLATGSINRQLKVSEFSSQGKSGDIVAPGESILSTWLNNQYIVLSGTSMATPYTSGVAALYLEKYGSTAYAERFFEQFANDIAPKGFDTRAFWGNVDPPKLFKPDSLIIDFPPRDSTITPDPPKTPGTLLGMEWWEILILIGIVVLGITGFIIFREKA